MRVGLGIAVVFYRWPAAPFRAYLPDDESGSGRKQRQQPTLAKLKVFLFTEIGLIAFPFSRFHIPTAYVAKSRFCALPPLSQVRLLNK